MKLVILLLLSAGVCLGGPVEPGRETGMMSMGMGMQRMGMRLNGGRTMKREAEADKPKLAERTKVIPVHQGGFQPLPKPKIHGSKINGTRFPVEKRDLTTSPKEALKDEMQGLLKPKRGLVTKNVSKTLHSSANSTTFRQRRSPRSGGSYGGRSEGSSSRSSSSYSSSSPSSSPSRSSGYSSVSSSGSYSSGSRPSSYGGGSSSSGSRPSSYGGGSSSSGSRPSSYGGGSSSSASRPSSYGGSSSRPSGRYIRSLRSAENETTAEQPGSIVAVLVGSVNPANETSAETEPASSAAPAVPSPALEASSGLVQPVRKVPSYAAPIEEDLTLALAHPKERRGKRDASKKPKESKPVDKSTLAHHMKEPFIKVAPGMMIKLV